jgi:hypothetical protein
VALSFLGGKGMILNFAEMPVEGNQAKNARAPLLPKKETLSKFKITYFDNLSDFSYNHAVKSRSN